MRIPFISGKPLTLAVRREIEKRYNHNPLFSSKWMNDDMYKLINIFEACLGEGLNDTTCRNRSHELMRECGILPGEVNGFRIGQAKNLVWPGRKIPYRQTQKVYTNGSRPKIKGKHRTPEEMIADAKAALAQLEIKRARRNKAQGVEDTMPSVTQFTVNENGLQQFSIPLNGLSIEVTCRLVQNGEVQVMS